MAGHNILLEDLDEHDGQAFSQLIQKIGLVMQRPGVHLMIRSHTKNQGFPLVLIKCLFCDYCAFSRQ